MSDKKDYTAEEVAKGLLEKAKEVVGDVLKKSDPRNQTSAQSQGLSVPQPKAPEAQTKVIAKQPLQLKKFMEKCEMKKNQAGK